MIEFETLGNIELVGSLGEDFSSILKGCKRLALLAYLAIAIPRGFHRRDKLLGFFWPELDQKHARNALRNLVYELRSGLGAGVLVNRGDEELGIDALAFRCDAIAFETALDVEDWERALQLYRVHLLDGFFLPGCPNFDFWLEGERERLHRGALGAAERLAAREEAVGNLGGAAHWARRAVALGPHEEGALRALIVILDRCGERASAVSEYERFARRLAEDLQLTPSPQTEALVDTIRARAAVIAAPVMRLAGSGEGDRGQLRHPGGPGRPKAAERGLARTATRRRSDKA